MNLNTILFLHIFNCNIVTNIMLIILKKKDTYPFYFILYKFVCFLLLKYGLIHHNKITGVLILYFYFSLEHFSFQIGQIILFLK